MAAASTIIFSQLKSIVKKGWKIIWNDGLQKIFIKNNFGGDVAQIANGLLKLNWLGFGGDIISNPAKTTTLIGRWENGLENIWSTGLAKQGDNVGGFNILGEIPQGDVVTKWQFNKTWLSDAMSRGDAIRVTADPVDVSNIIYQNVDDIFFDNFEEVAEYLNSFAQNSDEFNNLGFFGKEIHTLVNNGYGFNAATKYFEL